MERRRPKTETTDASPPTDREAELLLRLHDAEIKHGPPDPLNNDEMVVLERRAWAKRDHVTSSWGITTHTFEDQYLTQAGRLMCATAETMRLNKKRKR